MIYRDNLLYFMEMAWNPEDDFYIVVSGDSEINFINHENIKIIRTENRNRDLGGVCAAINYIGSRIGDYKYFFFINSSCRGPISSSGDLLKWRERFIDKLDSDVGVVGVSINILPMDHRYTAKYELRYRHSLPLSHVQTYAYLLTDQAVALLRDQGFYKRNDNFENEEIVIEYEILLSQVLKMLGFNLKCLLEEYNAIDYRRLHENINFAAYTGDPVLRGSYFGKTVNPAIVPFIKTNRGLMLKSKLGLSTLVALYSYRHKHQVLLSRDYSALILRAILQVLLHPLYWINAVRVRMFGY
jgi:hypothetical protein